MLSRSTQKQVITTLADTIHMRIVEFGTINSGYKSLIMSYTDSLFVALEEAVQEFGDQDDQATLARINSMLNNAVKTASVPVFSLNPPPPAPQQGI